MTWFNCEIGQGGGGTPKYITAKKRLFAPSGIGTNAWRDDTDSVSMYINAGGYTPTEGEKVTVNSTNQLRMSFTIDNSYNVFGIRCKIDPNFTPANTDLWYNASCIMGTELGGEQKDYAIVIDKNGYFALGWATANITSSSVYALDDEEHELFMVAFDNAIKLYVDGVEEVSVDKVMGGNQMTSMGVFWNNAGTATRTDGEIYAVGYWGYTAPYIELPLPTL